MKKILVIGSGGSGKSTLAKELSKKLNLPLIALDQYYWKPGWVRPEKEEWRKKVSELVDQDSWIMDGNYQSTLDIRFPKSDVIIFLDINRFICFWRMWKRRILKNRVDKIDGCPEKIDFKFIKWVLWEYPQRRRPKVLKLLEEYKDKKIFILRISKDRNNLFRIISV
ncbi:AAA family ATPase [Candidatus Falkowbacteria bacterium]|nr:AAA family ATPase [Candidatus Falkowbacteria bacterium]